MDNPPREPSSSRRYAFGPFRLDARERRLARGERAITLQPKVFDTLILLVENAGHLMSKEALMAALWPDAVVEESNLTKNIWSIRRSLGDADGGGTYVETVPRVGYRFVGEVRTDSEERESAVEHTPEARKDGPAPDVDANLDAGEIALARPTVEAEIPAPGDDSGVVPVDPHVAPVEVNLAAREIAAARAPEIFSWRPRRRFRWLPVVGLAAIAVAASILFAFRPRPRPAPVAASRASIPVRRSVAVLGLKNLSGRPDADWLGTALTAMVNAELAAGGQLRVVPAENVARRRVTPPAGGLSAETLAGLRSELNADEIVLGSYVAILAPGGEQIRVDLLVQNAASGETVASVSETGTESDLFRLVSSAGQDLRSKLGLAGPTAAEAAVVQASLPKDAEATRLYAQGLDRFRHGEPAAARDLLVRAVKIQPDFSLAHAALSDVWTALGYDRRAEEEAKKAFDRSEGLSREDRLGIEARVYEAGKQWDKAGEIYRSLFDLYSDNVEYGLKLAAVRVSGGQATMALETIAALRRIRGAASQDPRIDLAAADAAGALSDWPKEIEAADRAAATARSAHSVQLLAQARLRAGNALDSLGRPAESGAALREAAALFEQAGDRNGQARAWISLANAAGNQGDNAKALQRYRDALKIFEESGDQKGAAHAWSDLAIMDWFLGNVAAAETEGSRSLEISREIDDRRGIVWGLAALGNVIADQGQFDKARTMQEEALSIGRAMNDRAFTGFSLGALGDTALTRGDLATALSKYEEALEISRQLGDASGVAQHENDLGNVLLARGDLAASRAHYERALAGRERLGEKGGAAETRMLLAEVEKEEGHAARGLDLAREAAGVFESLHQSGNASIAFVEASGAELALGRAPAARQDVQKAVTILGHNQQNGARLPVLLAVARAEAASGNADAARSALAESRKRLATARWRAYIFEADLVEAEIDLKQGHLPEARRRLATVAAESRTAGFGLLARKAETLAANGGAANPFL